MMAHSGARGSKNQMKQLAGMRGLMAKPSGEIIETPIISNFKEGLTVLEYFNSTHGARKGLADTALKTANSGYLTRRLVDVAQDCIITEEDCGTQDGIKMTAVIDGADIVVSLGTRILGRTTAVDVDDPGTGKIDRAGRHLPRRRHSSSTIEKAGVQAVKVRSVLTCETRTGVCGACYGRDLARGTHVNIGEAVGVIAAQSIGEPGTQLTMRTFHIGGAAQVAEQSVMESAHDGSIRFDQPQHGEERAWRSHRHEPQHGGRRSSMPTARSVKASSCRSARVCKVDEKTKIKRGDRIAEWDPYATPILTEVAGKVKFEDLIEGVSSRDEFDEATGISSKVVIDWRSTAKGRSEAGDRRCSNAQGRRAA